MHFECNESNQINGCLSSLYRTRSHFGVLVFAGIFISHTGLPTLNYVWLPTCRIEIILPSNLFCMHLKVRRRRKNNTSHTRTPFYSNPEWSRNCVIKSYKSTSISISRAEALEPQEIIAHSHTHTNTHTARTITKITTIEWNRTQTTINKTKTKKANETVYIHEISVRRVLYAGINK